MPSSPPNSPDDSTTACNQLEAGHRLAVDKLKLIIITPAYTLPLVACKCRSQHVDNAVRCITLREYNNRQLTLAPAFSVN